MPVNSKIFSKGNKIIKKIQAAGYEAHFVGGCVRDYLLKRPIDDIDLVTSASPSTIEQIFDKTIPLGVEHGTMIIRLQGESIEVTSYRYEERLNILNPTPVQRLENDLSFRDFTMNAIAMDLNGKIIDPFNGAEDIKNGRIKGVNSPAERFLEDPLRILRALRFVSELDFTIEDETLKQMNALGEKINNVAVERLTDEFTKLLKGQQVAKSFDLLIRSNLHKYLPTIKDFPKIMPTLKKDMQPLQSLGEFFALCNVLEKDCTIRSMATSWKASRNNKQTAKYLYWALLEYDRYSISNWLVYQLTDRYLQAFIRINRILQRHNGLTYEKLQSIYINLPIHSAKEIKMNGRDLMKLFPEKKPGKWMSVLLKKIEQNIVQGKLVNNYTNIKEWVLCHPPESN